MRTRRILAAVAITATLVLGGAAGSVSAQSEPYTTTQTAVCNTTTGEFDLTVTLSDAPDAPFLLTDTRYTYKTASSDAGPILTPFVPSTMPKPPATASASFSVPGDSVAAQLEWNVDGRIQDGEMFDLPADCVAIPVTTTVPDTSPETTVAPAAEAVAAAASPRFTG